MNTAFILRSYFHNSMFAVYYLPIGMVFLPNILDFFKITNILHLHFQGQTSGILLFCCNCKTVGLRTIHFDVHAHIYERIYVEKKPMVMTFISRSDFQNCIGFGLYNLTFWTGMWQNISTFFLCYSYGSFMLLENFTYILLFLCFWILCFNI